MDPFTQRMRERALLSQEKLNSKLKDAGLEPTKIRYPLTEQHHQTHTVKITTEEVSISKPRPIEVKVLPAKTESGNLKDFLNSPADLDTSGKENEIVQDSESSSEEEEEQGKSPVTSSIREDSRSRLKRLGTLYSESPSMLSSPLHRTEDKFSVEPDMRTRAKTPARSARLAALANTINQWEDDLSHPTASVDDTYVRSPVKEPQSPTKRCNVAKMTADEPAAKHVTWDKAILDTLDSSTSSVNSSPSNRPWQRPANLSSSSLSSVSLSPEKPARVMPRQDSAPSVNASQPNRPWQRPANLSSSSLSSVSLSPEKPARAMSPEKPIMGTRAISPEKRAPRMMEDNGSSLNGSVLQKAMIFESSPTKKKDPAELTLAERMALFERNKGEALVPKSAFGIPAPMAKIVVSERMIPKFNSVDKPVEKVISRPVVKVNKTPMESVANKSPQKSAPIMTEECLSMVAAQRDMFERGGGRVAHQNIANAVQSERQKEMAMLLNRWNKNKQIDNDDEEMEVEEPSKPLPQVFLAPVQQQISTPPPPPPMPSVMSPPPASPGKDHSAPGKDAHYPGLKRIKVSPPKPGNLYPCLSDIETATEVESDSDHRDYSSSELESSLEAGESSFGRSIMQAVRHDAARSLTESAVMKDMDQLLEDAMDSSSDSDDEGVTPPKQCRARDTSPTKAGASAASHSFKYSRGDVPTTPVNVTPSSVQAEQVPLLHTVSFYRRQQNSGSKKTPIRQITRQAEPTNAAEVEESGAAEKEAVAAKVTYLLRDVSKQQSVISQASQALNLCSSTVEFSGSAESVEGERLLLFATHARQAALNEVQRLKVEGSLKPLTEFGQTVDANERGNVTLSDIQLPLKPDFVRRMAKDDDSQHFMVLVKHQDQVLATPVVSPRPDSSSLVFSSCLRLNDLYSDFKIVLEVYALRARKEVLPHDVKYHINKKDKGRGTPKKSRLVMPICQSPAGPGAVRSPAFRLVGFVTFSLNTLKRTHFTLNNHSQGSPLEGQVHVKLSSRLTTDVEQRGFLTMFEDVSGLGAWHRRWCVLRGAAISYWRYPDEEKIKVPMGGIELSGWSSSSVDRVPYDVCARPETFVLKMVRPMRPGDRDSLVLTCSAHHATIRYMLSADTREERLLWCEKLSKALTMMRAWGDSNSSSAQTQ